MYPILQPGSLVIVDITKRKIVMDSWTTEFERPIYFLELERGWACAWCSVQGRQLVVQAHPASGVDVQILDYPEEVDIVGQVTGVAMRLGQGRPPRGHS